MEDYRKSGTSSTSTQSIGISNHSNQQNDTIADNEVRVTTNATIERLVDIGLNKLEDHTSIVVAAKGNSINKAVTVAEIIKRRLAGALHQYNQVGKVTSTEQWDPVKDSELDSIAVDTILPVIIIHLAKATIPELEVNASYQEPNQYD